MATLGRLVFVLHVPVTVALLLWAWLGRLLIGSDGWFPVILPLIIGPWIVLALTLSFTMSYLNGRRPRAFNGPESLAVGALWLGLFGIGFFINQFGDAEDEEYSLFTELAGHSADRIDLSGDLTVVSSVVAFAGWVALVGLLFLDHIRKPEPDTADD